MVEVAVYRHKYRKEYYLERNYSLGGGGPTSDFYNATKDFFKALHSYKKGGEDFLHWAKVFKDDTGRTVLQAKCVDMIEANIDGYTGKLTKELVFDVADFEKIVFVERTDES